MASGQEKRSGTMSTMEAQSDDPRFKRRIPASFYENEQAQFEKLPHGWEVAEKGDRKYFVDHKNKVTTWVDPRTKPLRKQDVSAVQMGELPYGWEEAVDPDFGVYYINHLVQSNYVDPPWDPVVRDQVSQLQQYLTQQIEKEKRTLEEREKVEHSKLDEAAKKVEQLEREKLALERDLAFLQQKAMASDTESDATSVLSEKMAKIDDELEAMRKQDIPKSRMEFEQRLMELVALNNTLANQGPGFDEVKHYQKTEAEIREVNAQLEREASLRYELEKQIIDLKRQMEETHGFSASPRLGDGSSPDLYYSSPPTQYMDEPRMQAGGMTRKTRFEMEAELLMLKKRLQAEKSEKARLTNLKDEMELENSKGKMPNWIREINNVAASSKTLRVKIGKQQVKNPDVLTFRERMLFFAAGSVDPNIAAKRH